MYTLKRAIYVTRIGNSKTFFNFELSVTIKHLTFFLVTVSFYYAPVLKKRGYTVLALTVLPSIPIFSVTLFSATMHHSNFKAGMLRWLRVLHVT